MALNEDSRGVCISRRMEIVPLYRVEIGYPSGDLAKILDFCENPNNPDTAYVYVPIELVEMTIAAHGVVKANV